jgi:hypothetical protein
MRVEEAPIENLCAEDLERMRLDPGGLQRHCDRCSKAVHDLSALGPERARALLAGTRGSICISYTADHDGELVFDSPRPRSPAKVDFVPLARLARAATLVASLSACTPHQGEGEVPLEIHEPATEVFDTPPMIPTQAVPVERPPTTDEPCEPAAEPLRTPESEKPRPVKGKYKLRGVHISHPYEGPLD